MFTSFKTLTHVKKYKGTRTIPEKKTQTWTKVYQCWQMLLTLLPASYFQNYLPRGGGGAQSSSTLKSAVLAIFLHTNQQKPFQGTLGTQDHTSIGSKTILGPSWDPKRPLKWTLWFLRKFCDFWENFGFFYILHSLAPLTMLEHLLGHCPTVPRLRGPSWTFMDLQMDP